MKKFVKNIAPEYPCRTCTQSPAIERGKKEASRGMRNNSTALKSASEIHDREKYKGEIAIDVRLIKM